MWIPLSYAYPTLPLKAGDLCHPLPHFSPFSLPVFYCRHLFFLWLCVEVLCTHFISALFPPIRFIERGLQVTGSLVFVVELFVGDDSVQIKSSMLRGTAREAISHLTIWITQKVPVSILTPLSRLLFSHSRDWLFQNYRCVRWWKQDELAVWPAEWGESCIFHRADPKSYFLVKYAEVKVPLWGVLSLCTQLPASPHWQSLESQRREAPFLTSENDLWPRHNISVSFTRIWPISSSWTAELGHLNGLGPLSCGCRI